MIVTPRAVERQAEKRLPNHADEILHLILPHGLAHGIVVRAGGVVWAGDEAGNGNHAVGRAGLQHVASDLHFHKPIVG